MTAAIALALLRRFWWAVPTVALGAALLITLGKLADTRQTLRNERSAWSAEIDRADRARADQERRFAERLAGATSSFADRLAAREPIIIHSTDTVREYAQTDAGRARCLGADRVRGLDAYLAALDNPHPAPAGGSAEALRADADPAPTRR